MCAQDIKFGLWIIGIICAAALAVSIVLSFAEFLASVTNQCGRHTAGLAFPMGYVPRQFCGCMQWCFEQSLLKHGLVYIGSLAFLSNFYF